MWTSDLLVMICLICLHCALWKIFTQFKEIHLSIVLPQGLEQDITTTKANDYFIFAKNLCQ